MANDKTQVTTVKMDDDRIVEFPGKRILQKESFIGEDGSVKIRLDWRNGETRTFTIPTALLLQFAAHGAEQKLGDQIAGLKDDKGNDAEIEDKILAVDELIEQLNAGEWSARRESSGLAGTSILLRALMELYGKSKDEIKAFLKDKTAAQKTALRANAKVKPIIDRLQAEKDARSAKKVDTDALLGELDASEA